MTGEMELQATEARRQVRAETDAYIPWWIPEDHPTRTGAVPIPAAPDAAIPTPQPETPDAPTSAEATENPGAEADGG